MWSGAGYSVGSLTESFIWFLDPETHRITRSTASPGFGGGNSGWMVDVGDEIWVAGEKNLGRYLKATGAFLPKGTQIYSAYMASTAADVTETGGEPAMRGRRTATRRSRSSRTRSARRHRQTSARPRSRRPATPCRYRSSGRSPGSPTGPVDRKFYIWNGGIQWWTFDPATRIVVRLPQPTVGFQSIATKKPVGIYGRMRYAPDLDVFVVAFTGEDNVWLWRP